MARPRLIGTCSKCGKYNVLLVSIDNADETATYTEITKTRYEVVDSMCLECAFQYLGIDKAEFQEDSTTDSTEFLLALLKGNIAQVIVRTYLQCAGYEVYPYGYENYLSNVSKSLRTSNGVSAKRIRSTPDLFAYNENSGETILVEVKATTIKNETKYYMPKSKLEDYSKYWGESVLAFYCLRTGNIYCKKINQIDVSSLTIIPAFGKNVYVLNLERDFGTLPSEFNLIAQDRYTLLRLKVEKVIAEFTLSRMI